MNDFLRKIVLSDSVPANLRAEALDLLLDGKSTTTVKVDDATFLRGDWEALRGLRPINAIKALREKRPSLSLITAKNAVDEFERRGLYVRPA